MTQAKRLLDLCITRGMMIATAESCTGGMVAAALTDLPGSSSMFERGFVTYTNAAKQEMLGVTSQSLDQFGAVSEQVAHEMALGAQSRSHADLAVSLTGIAGPGGSDFKPEGRVCFGVAFLDDVHVSTVEFGAIGRTHVRRAATDHALMLMIEALS